MRILIDNGHGSNTVGKCSPDGSLKEYAWAREIAQRIVEKLTAQGYNAQRIVIEDSDVPLAERCRRVNAVCKEHGVANVLLVSVHNNAAANGGWQKARGWSVWVYTQAGEKSKRLAQLLYAEAERIGLKGNRSVPTNKYWEANFYILKHSACPSVLTENLFQDNKEDVAYLLSKAGKEAIVQLHVKGIINYIKSLGR